MLAATVAPLDPLEYEVFVHRLWAGREEGRPLTGQPYIGEDRVYACRGCATLLQVDRNCPG